ncbi:hypothetical protein G6045_35355, partial [Streptomyces sp. YC504]|nr:hypothetical protein [Streptomyces mesophilus]
MTHLDLEEELAAAMLDRTEQVPPRAYDVDAVFATVQKRRRRLQWGAAAAVAAVALGAGFVAQNGPGRVATPAQATPTPSAATQSTSPPAHV